MQTLYKDNSVQMPAIQYGCNVTMAQLACLEQVWLELLDLALQNEDLCTVPPMTELVGDS